MYKNSWFWCLKLEHETAHETKSELRYRAIFYIQFWRNNRVFACICGAIDDFLLIHAISECVKSFYPYKICRNEAENGKIPIAHKVRRTALFQIKRNFREKISVDNNKIPIRCLNFSLEQTNYFIITCLQK